MKVWSKALLVAVLALSLVGTAHAGSYSRQDATLFLDGQVLIRFDQLLLGWTTTDSAIDHLRYQITCLKGKIVLNNVEYLDRAFGSDQDVVRWKQSPSSLGRDLSYKNFHMDRHHPVSFWKHNKLDIAPYDLDTAKVRFHFHTLGRDYQVTWIPKTGELSSVWQ
ncbi:MAG: hypothetical protein GX442_06700 [Candidatus Riflebacteria bacterium]|nr:hypothetical protein [Candidatus Riflebacteria bacterium]